MSPAWRRRARVAAIPSTLFAAVVFVLGWMEVSPFAAWPLGLILLLSAPALVPFVMLTADLSAARGRRRWSPLDAPPLPTPVFRWRDVLTRRQSVVVGLLAVVVAVSFLLSIGESRGTPETVDGRLVFTDRGTVIGPATPRQADEERTRVSRMFGGHLMLFGVVGLLASVPPASSASRHPRPSSGAPSRLDRPGGPRDV